MGQRSWATKSAARIRAAPRLRFAMGMLSLWRRAWHKAFLMRCSPKQAATEKWPQKLTKKSENWDDVLQSQFGDGRTTNQKPERMGRFFFCDFLCLFVAIFLLSITIFVRGYHVLGRQRK